MKIKSVWVVFVIALFSFGFGQIQTSGQLDVVIRNPNAKDNTNKTFAKYSNFDFVRGRLFFDAQPAENISVFFQLLADNSDLIVYGAYLRISLFDQNLNIHAGLIPNTVGIWGPRTYSDKNPFIGIPLLYNYHTSYSFFGNIDKDVNVLLAKRAKGWKSGGFPILYDFCWNTGVELFGSNGIVDWSVAATSGSVTYPSRQPVKDLPQFTSRFSIFPVPEFNFSLSAYWGPYLTDAKVEKLTPLDSNSTKVYSVNDFINKGIGIGLVFSKEYYEIFSESFWSAWDHPYFGELNAYSSYADFKYKFAPQWYAAVRGELMRFSKITGPSGKTEWDYPLNRYDLVLGYKMDRNVVLKLNTQVTRYPDKSNFNDFILATQISTSF